MNEGNLIDAIVIGGGPAGQSAALYLARFNRSVLVFDRGTSRTLTFELNENYLGFPQGIRSRQLYQLGREQAERYGAYFSDQEILSITSENEVFIVTTATEMFTSRSVIIATGVTDLYPNIPDYKEYLGKTLFWCITCDGYKTRQKKVVVIGDTDEAACTAMQFLNYTPDVALITNYNPPQAEISAKWRERLWSAHVEVFESPVKGLRGVGGMVESVLLDNNQEVPAEMVFNMQGAVPNNKLAVALGVLVNSDGYIEASDEQRTNIPFVYAAGDVTRMFAHQIVTAAHEGSMAAQAANYDLYRPDQRM